jgi:hypothetical protein
VGAIFSFLSGWYNPLLAPPLFTQFSSSACPMMERCGFFYLALKARASVEEMKP